MDLSIGWARQDHTRWKSWQWEAGHSSSGGRFAWLAAVDPNVSLQVLNPTNMKLQMSPWAVARTFGCTCFCYRSTRVLSRIWCAVWSLVYSQSRRFPCWLRGEIQSLLPGWPLQKQQRCQSVTGACCSSRCTSVMGEADSQLPNVDRGYSEGCQLHFFLLHLNRCLLEGDGTSLLPTEEQGRLGPNLA